MNEFRPILQGDASKLERLLLSSSQLDVPPHNAKRRALNVLGLGSSVIATAQVTGVTTATAATQAAGVASAAAAGSSAVATIGATSGLLLALSKGLAIGAITGALAYGSLALREQGAQTGSTITSANVTAPKQPAERDPLAHTTGSGRAVLDAPTATSSHDPGSSIGATPEVVNSATHANLVGVKQPTAASARQPLKSVREGILLDGASVDHLTAGRAEAAYTTESAAVTPSAVPTQVQPPTPQRQQSFLQSERATIELAQALVRSGDPAAALRTLSAHALRYPKPQLAPEAMLVRMEALLELGQVSEAQRLGSRFLLAHPDGPYAQRVRSLLNL
jgi:TolA-binding protein